MGQRVAILGASHKPERFAFKAFQLLREYGHTPILVNPHSLQKNIEGFEVFEKLSELKEKIDTLTMYVGPAISTTLAQEIRAAKPSRVIFNPGSENPELENLLRKDGIEVVEACTLVMLQTQQF
jgi:predicted CoA-binding protein